MSQPTYLALLSALRAIEDALGLEVADIPAYTGPAIPPVLPAEQEDLFRIAAEQLVAGLHDDRFDPPGPPGEGHNAFSASPPGWMKTGSIPPPSTQTILYVARPPGGGEQLAASGADLYGKIKSALGGS